MTLADRIVVMNDGYIEQIGTPMELFTNPANTFVASFIGSPPMNQMFGKITSSPSRPIAATLGVIVIALWLVPMVRFVIRRFSHKPAT